MVEHYFSKKQTGKFKLSKINVILRGFSLELYTASGIFSSRKIDFGTKVLIENMAVSEKDDVLDLGCGIGVVGLVASKLTKGKVLLTDVNERACKVAVKNSVGRENIEVISGDMYEAVSGDMYEAVKGQKFDVILLNPPQTAGRKVCFKMIEDAKKYLKKNGSLQLVARHNKGGRVLSGKMKEVFGNMETIVKKGGYRVYVSKLK